MNSLLAIYFFELGRMRTAGRVIWWFILTGFPIGLIGLLRFVMEQNGSQIPPDGLNAVWIFATYSLLPCVACMLGVYLTAAPAVATELEQKSWSYLATRPNGLFHLILGKYLAAVSWSISAGIVSTTLAVPLTSAENRLELWMAMCGLVVCSSVAYAALYMLIGTLFPKRAMVICVAYSVGAELLLSMIPAVINRFTVQFRLRTLLSQWVTIPPQLQETSVLEYITSENSVVEQLLWLAALTTLFMAAALVIVHKREFTQVAESDL